MLFPGSAKKPTKTVGFCGWTIILVFLPGAEAGGVVGSGLSCRHRTAWSTLRALCGGEEGEPREAEQTQLCGAAHEVRMGSMGTEGGQRLHSLPKTRCNHVIKDDINLQTYKGRKCSLNYGIS